MNIETVLTHYLVCVLWAEMGTQFDRDDIATESKDKAREDITKFIDDAGELVAEYEACEFGPESGGAAAQFGHDFWLTRCGHGTGFWDRQNLPDELGEKLTELCKTFAERCAYVGDDGRIYID